LKIEKSESWTFWRAQRSNIFPGRVRNLIHSGSTIEVGCYREEMIVK